jgi:hypothetical protein
MPPVHNGKGPPSGALPVTKALPRRGVAWASRLRGKTKRRQAGSDPKVRREAPSGPVQGMRPVGSGQLCGAHEVAVHFAGGAAAFVDGPHN